MKKLIGWLVAALALFVVVNNPEGAAATVNDVTSSLSTFVTHATD